MKKQTIKLVLAVCVLVAVAFTATAVAEGNGDNNEDAEEKKKTYQQEEYKKKRQEEVREKTDKIKEEVSVRKLQIKKDVCESRKDKLEAKIPRLSGGAVNLQEVFDKVYERVQNFYVDKQLTVDNYEELKAAVDAAQAEAETAVEAAKSYQVELDCDNPEMGQKLDGFRQSVKDAKKALKDYREALVKLISAIKAEAAEGNNE